MTILPASSGCGRGLWRLHRLHRLRWLQSLPRLRCRAVAAGLLVSLLAVAGCGGAGERAGEAAAGELAPMPEFTLAALGGETFGKADFAGKVVLFDFWATWCGPCHLQADILKEIYPGASSRGIDFVAVSTGEEAATVRDFVARRPFPYAVLVDPEEVLGAALDIAALPTLVVMDGEGRIRFSHTGVADAETIEAALRAAGAPAASSGV